MVIYFFQIEEPGRLRIVPKGFINRTSCRFTKDMMALISYGPKFVIPHTGKEMGKLMGIIEDVEEIEPIEEPYRFREKADRVKSEILNAILGKDIKLNAMDRYIMKATVELMDFLKRNENIYIMEADKGKAVVAISMEEYTTLFKEMIRKGQMNGLYRRECMKGKDTTERREEIIKKVLRNKYDFWKRKIVREGIYKDRDSNVLRGKEKRFIKLLENVDNELGIMYPRLKIHKPVISMRPVVSREKVINVKIGYIINILLKEIKMDWDKKNSVNINVRKIEDLKERLGGLRYKRNRKFYVMDIKSMFDEISREEVIRIIGELMNEEIYNKELIMGLIRFDLYEANYFKLRSEEGIFKQNRGVPMGSGTSVIYAEIITDYYYVKMREDLERMGVDFIAKYIDDYLVSGIIGNMDRVKDIMEFYTELEFKVEEEVDNEISYLDMCLVNEEGRISTKWCKKGYVSSRLVNFKSFQPLQMKKGILKARILRMIRITDLRYMAESLEEIINEFIDNDYPWSVIKEIIVKVTEELKLDGIREDDVNIQKVKIIEETWESIIRRRGIKMKDLRKRKNMRVIKKAGSRRCNNPRQKFIRIPYMGERKTRDLKRKIRMMFGEVGTSISTSYENKLMYKMRKGEKK